MSNTDCLLLDLVIIPTWRYFLTFLCILDPDLLQQFHDSLHVQHIQCDDLDNVSSLSEHQPHHVGFWIDKLSDINVRTRKLIRYRNQQTIRQLGLTRRCWNALGN